MEVDAAIDIDCQVPPVLYLPFVCGRISSFRTGLEMVRTISKAGPNYL